MKKLLLTFLIGVFCTCVYGQRTVRGTVTDSADGSPLPGVSVQVKGTTRGAITDIDGNYQVSVEQTDKVLVFSFIGMKTEEVQIKERSNINVALSMDAIAVDEVVVTALGIKREQKSLSFSQQGVDASTMAEVRDQNIISSLSGKAAGVQVVPPSSSVGSARIVIRGNSSFTGNNQPLFVVDGMVMDNSAGDDGVNPGGGIDYGNGAADLNPSDIESIEILKGPNAAALYGSRAANGVILVTTKKGKEGRFKVSLNSNTQFSFISQYPDFQNTFGVGHVATMVGSDTSSTVIDEATGLPKMAGMMQRQGSRSAGSPMMGQKYIGLDGKIYEYSPQPNNVKDFYQTAHIITNNVSVEGGTADNNYRVSYTNMIADDFVEKQNKVSKNTVNLRFFNTFVKGITLDSKIMYVKDKTTNRQYLNGDTKNPVYAYINMPRSMSLSQLSYYKDEYGKEFGSSDFRNPFWLINENHNMDDKSRLLASFDLSFQILKELKMTLRYGRDQVYTRGYEFQNSGAYSNAKGYYRDFHNSMENDTYEFLFVFDKKFGSDYSLFATFGGSRNDNKGYNSWASISSLKQQGFAHISNSNDYPETDEYLGKKRINSLYGMASFGYKNWAFIELTGRNDWSSTLPPANRSYFYPSVGLSWIVSDMLNIHSSDFYGKIRASYANVGNDTHPYNLLTAYNMGTTNIVGGYKYLTLPDTQLNSDLKPERTTSYEVGADLRFLNNRLNVDFTYYYSKSKDQIIRAQMSSAAGFPYRYLNAGAIENKGIELSVTGIPIQTKNFNWEITANFTKNNSKVLEMVDGYDRIQLQQSWSSIVYVEKGKPYGVVRARAWAKDEDGNRLVDEKGKPIVLEDQYLGNANPKWMLGIGNRFKIYDFDVYALIDIKHGGGLFSGSRKQGIRSGVFPNTFGSSGNPMQDGVDYWERSLIFGDPGGDKLWGGTYFNNIYFAKKDALGNYVNSGKKCEYYFMPQEVGYYADEMDELVYYDASFVKLRELSVGYNVPKKWLSKIKLQSARVAFVGRNLWIIHQNTPNGLDPEATSYSGNGQGLETGSLPPSTTLGFDIKLSF